MMAVNRRKEVTRPTVYCVRLSVNVTFAQNTAGLVTLRLHVNSHLGKI